MLISLTSNGSKYIDPSLQISGILATFETKVGQPIAIASNGGYPNPSYKEGKIKKSTLDELNDKKIRFGLSNVLEHKGKKNNILIDWLDHNNYIVNYITANYANSNYQTKKKNTQNSTEVLITNYKPTKKHKETLTLF